MLCYKGWLETRFRLLLALGGIGFVLFMLDSVRPGAKAPVFAIVQNSNPAALLVICSLLAGAGIATQASFGPSKGLHGSMLFTLSLPVSRFRLLAVRAGIGWLEMAGVIGTLCCGMWLVSPLLRTIVTAGEMFAYGGTLLACASAVYFLSVLLATFLEDQWRIWGTMIVYMALWWLSAHTPLPTFADIFGAMGKRSPLIAHTMPWNAIAFSLGLAAILFFAALKVVKTREY
jgi:ABC-2 type transport system permease protein